MLGQCVYVGRTVECLGIRSQVDAVLASNTHLHCGVIGEATKIVVRSRSSRLFWLVQMSTEMWEFAPDGEIYYEKLLNRLLRVLIDKWSESSVTHSVTIIAFSRSFYDANQLPDGFDPTKPPFSDPRRQGFGPGCGAPGINMANGYGPTIHVDPVSGRYYEDFYKVVVMNFVGPDWSRLLLLLKKEFTSYYETHRWRTPEELSPAHYDICRCPKPVITTNGEGTMPDNPDVEDSACEDLYVKWTKLPSGVPSRAKDGNILEAINVTLNVLDKHYMDRDLSRTGQGIVMMTAGCSIFNVNRKLAEITEQRMMDNGVEYSSVSRVQIHPLVASVFLPLPARISKSFVAALTQTLDFVLDDERIADGCGIGYGLGIDQETSTNKPRTKLRGHRRSPSANARLLRERWQQRGYKQLIHRRVPVFVRIIHDGLIWIPGYDYDRKGDDVANVAAAEALFQEVCSAIEARCCENTGESVSL
ncbi:hypothetical protein PHMEG_0006368 [Phytophthora megakarya]|uniref:Vacuolar membrane-associated protein Iml1 N-terminal domain-containing protein n=1 Tax=Phytophthora megakarya TaxID=4795 RepID=A0A225WR38_9STRA|nr:hypothetical protein PHMEG_0006368 [Phytophthora megakarya]